VADYLARRGHSIELHYLPKYAPPTNPLERVWRHLRETITCNQRCQPLMELLLRLMRRSLRAHHPSAVRDTEHRRKPLMVASAE